MASAKNWTTVTESSFPRERDALDFVRSRFPTHEPYRAWSNFEFIADDGSINEVDRLVDDASTAYMAPEVVADEDMGDYFEGFVTEQARRLGKTVDEIKAWTPPARTGGRGRRRSGT